MVHKTNFLKNIFEQHFLTWNVGQFEKSVPEINCWVGDISKHFKEPNYYLIRRDILE
jgi:hypothetical protein